MPDSAAERFYEPDSSGFSDEELSFDNLAASRIGRKLREKFDRIASEPIPDRFSDLLKQLDGVGGNADKGEGSK